MVRPSKGRTRRWSVRLRAEIDELLERVAEERGISKNDLLEAIILEWAYQNGYNKILHSNFRNNTITVWDSLLNATVDLVYEEPEKVLYCTYCHSTKCGHIWAASRLPEVREKVRRGELFIE